MDSPPAASYLPGTDPRCSDFGNLQLVDIRLSVRTIVSMATAEPLRSVRDHLSEVVDRVEYQHERVIITRNGRDAAVVISTADLAELEETIAVLSDPRLWPTFARPMPPTPAAM